MAKLPAAVAASVARLRSSSFERHGIDHLSASSINTWIASPALWVMERLLQRKAAVGCAAHRGTAVEAGISHGLFNGAGVVECAALAARRYDELAHSSADPKREEERGALAAMVQEGLNALLPRGRPLEPAQGENQRRVEIELEGVAVPFVGFLDFEWPGDVFDTKTTHRIPSEISPPHRRQGAVYQHDRSNSAVSFAYISSKKSLIHTLTREQYAEGIAEVRHSAIRLGRFLSLSDDPHELAAILTPDFSTFHWSSPEARELGRKTYGF